MWTRPSSAIREAVFTNSWRRSRLMSGSGMRTIFPSTWGLKPRFAIWIAFSTAFTRPGSHGWTWIMRASGVVMAAHSFSRIDEP